MAEIFKIGNMKIYEGFKIKNSSDYKFEQQLNPFLNNIKFLY